MSPIKGLSFKINTPYLPWKILSITMIGVMIASIIGSAYFMYIKIYRTLDDANTIVILNSNEQLDTLNTKSHEKAQELVQLKKDVTPLPKELRPIFVKMSTSTL